MSYTHLTKTELVFIEKYHEVDLSGRKIAKKTSRSHEAVYRVIRQLEGYTIIGRHHKSAVTTLVERKSKCIIALKPDGRQADHIESSLHSWSNELPRNLFKSIIFDCGKEFSNWQSVSHEQDIDIYFADPGTPSQRGLNEHSNGLLRRNGLPKEMDFKPVSQAYIAKVARKRNNIPRKSLGYLTSIEYFMKHVDQKFDKIMLSRLI